MEEGSRGDMRQRIGYVNFRITVLGYILKEKSLLFEDNWLKRIEKYFEQTQKIFEEIIKLSEFNEVTTPEVFKLLCAKNSMQRLLLFKKNCSVQEMIKTVIEIYSEIEKFSSELIENKNELFEELSLVLYENMSLSSWHSEPFLNEENKEIIQVISNQVIIDAILFYLSQNFEQEKGSVTRVLLSLSKISPQILEDVTPFFKEIKHLQVSQLFKEIIEGFFFKYKFFFFYFFFFLLFFFFFFFF